MTHLLGLLCFALLVALGGALAHVLDEGSRR